MFNKFYSRTTTTGNVPGGSLKGSLDNISRFLSTEPRIVGLDLFLAAPGLPQGWPERQGSYPSYAFGVPAPGRHSWCGSPHTLALRPNASGRGLAPSRRYR